MRRQLLTGAHLAYENKEVRKGFHRNGSLLFATIEDEVHEEDLRCVRSLKAVVAFDEAVNW